MWTELECKLWVQCCSLVKESVVGLGRFARLQKLLVGLAGRHLYIRFHSKTGDAMGMNGISKVTVL